jgi:hypothetical protein
MTGKAQHNIDILVLRAKLNSLYTAVSGCLESSTALAWGQTFRSSDMIVDISDQ